jgi:hypothetical protein
VRFGAAAICWRYAGVQAATVVGAEAVVARGGFSADETVGATRGQTSGSLALTACPCPSCGDVGEGLPTTAFALRSSLLLFSRPRQRSLSLLQWSLASIRSLSSCGPSDVEVVHTAGVEPEFRL